MIRPPLGKSIALAPILLGLGGCAFAPSPFGGAPVEERSLRPPPPPPPQVEVRPLERPLPIIPREYSAAAPTPVIPPEPFPAQPYEPPPAPPTAAAPP
ncbi:MAG: OmpA family protein, partial [Pseudomonadota bacterium]|nr:OmpA family protein [Pseudomonadota bacterium]